MTVVGAALVVTGVACIVLGFVWYLVTRHRTHHAELPAWTSAFADRDGAVTLTGGRRGSRGIEISLTAPRNSEPSPGPSSVPVLVTGTSSPSGVAVVRALVSAGFEVVALDHDRLAAGLRLAQLGAVIPPASDGDFGTTIAKIAQRTGARTLVPGDSTELRALVASADMLGEAGVTTWFPSSDLIDACSDGRSLSSALSKFAPSVHDDHLGEAESTCRPFEADLLAHLRGSVVAAVPRWRLATCGRFTTAAETFQRDDISSLLDEICRDMQIEGPATVSGFAGDEDAVITDVSLGFSSCVALNAAAGADMVVAYTKKLQGECLPPAPMPYRSGVRMVRHLDEVFET